MSKTYFVIDTDEYAGNFERELCAFMTGVTGGCGVGSKIADHFKDELKGFKEDLICSEPDEHGCWRPVKIWPSKSGKYKSIAIGLEVWPANSEVEFLKNRAHKFSEISNKNKEEKENIPGCEYLSGFNILKFRSVTEETITKSKEI